MVNKYSMKHKNLFTAAAGSNGDVVGTYWRTGAALAKRWPNVFICSDVFQDFVT